MNSQFILYVGEREAGSALAEIVEAEGGYVYLPETMMQALGMYITYAPHIVVIDLRLEWAVEALDHLRSVNARPIILLTDDHMRSASLYALSVHTSTAHLADFINRVGDYVPHPLPL